MRAALLLLVASACQARTELVIGIATDLEAPAAIDRVELVVNDGELQMDWDITGSTVPFNLPGSYGLVADGSTTVDLLLVARRGGTEVVSRRATLGLIEGETLFYRMGLAAACAGRDDCPEGWTCLEGLCREVAIDPAQLPAFAPELVGELTCGGAVRYIDTITRAPMPATADAGDCEADLCREGTCLRPPPESNGERTVRGSQIISYVEPTGTTHRPIDLSELEVAALVSGGDGLAPIAGTGTADGTFTISDVPGGEYYLQLGRSYVVTRASAIDLGFVVLGRPDQTYPSAPSTIRFDVTNLTPGETYEIAAWAPTANAWWFNLEDRIAIPPSSSALSSFVVSSDHAANGGTLIAGDAFALVQFGARPLPGGGAYMTAEKMFKPAPFSMVDGGEVMVSGAFVEIPQTSFASFDVRATAWDAAAGYTGTTAPALHPRATPAEHGIKVALRAIAGTGNYGRFSVLLDYLFLYVPGGSDRVLGEIAYGRPHVGYELWTPIVQSSRTFHVDHLLEGTSTPETFTVGLYDFRIHATGSTVVTPGIGPVRAPTIGGRSLFSPQSGVGTRPEITWDAPAFGAPSQYWVSLYELRAEGASTSASYVGEIITEQRGIEIPPDLLIAGRPYVLVIGASTAATSTSPYRSRFPDSLATIVSEVFVP